MYRNRVLSETRKFVNHQAPRGGSKYRRNYHIRKPSFLPAWQLNKLDCKPVVREHQLNWLGDGWRHSKHEEDSTRHQLQSEKAGRLRSRAEGGASQERAIIQSGSIEVSSQCVHSTQ